MNEAQIKRVQSVLEGWARWRCDRHGVGWSRKTITGKLLDGMPGTGCPTCSGKGRVKGADLNAKANYVICPTCGGGGRVKMDLNPDVRSLEKDCGACDSTGEINGSTCYRCRGSGKVNFTNTKVNPACIQQTAFSEPSMPLYERVDHVLSAWRRNPSELKKYLVILYEYTRTGRQIDKANRLKISARWYRQLLLEAHTAIYDGVM